MDRTDIALRREISAEKTVVAEGWGTGYFPVVVRLKTGEVIAVIRGGAEHMGVGGRLDIVRSKDAGATWSKPSTAFDTPDDDRNPALGQSSKGTLILAFMILKGYAKGYLPHRGTPDYKFTDYLKDVWVPEQSSTESYVITSEDNGRSWGETTKIAVPDYSVSPFGRIVELDNGELLMNVYGSKKGGPPLESTSFALRSSDDGRTWGNPVKIAEGLNETAFLPLDDGKVLAACRSDEPEEATYIVSSPDRGANWGRPERVTQALQHPADLCSLRDGRVLLVYGHRRFPFGVRGRVSRDQGLTWSRDEIVFAEDAESQDCGYPSVVSLPRGLGLVLYYQLGSHTVANLEGRCTAIRFRERAVSDIR